MAMSDGRPFQLQYDSPTAKEVRSGAPASYGNDLKKDPPPFDILDPKASVHALALNFISLVVGIYKISLVGWFKA